MSGRRLSPDDEARLTPFARALRAALAAAGKAQGELAAHLGLVPGAVANVCTTRDAGVAFTEENTRKAARFLGADEEVLVRARRESQRTWSLRRVSPAHAHLGAALEEEWEKLTPAQAEGLAVIVRAIGGLS